VTKRPGHRLIHIQVTEHHSARRPASWSNSMSQASSRVKRWLRPARARPDVTASARFRPPAAPFMKPSTARHARFPSRARTANTSDTRLSPIALRSAGAAVALEHAAEALLADDVLQADDLRRLRLWPVPQGLVAQALVRADFVVIALPSAEDV